MCYEAQQCTGARTEEISDPVVDIATHAPRRERLQ